MVTRRTITTWGPDGHVDTWTPTTLDALDKSEEFFEEVLASSVELLGIEARRTGIQGPFRIFRQSVLPTPSGRTIYPDITILAASGHVVVVEVKRCVNPELRDRAVIAQIIDYASSFASLSESQVLDLFRGTASAQTWGELVGEIFADEPEPDELAEVLRARMQDGALHLVIACDKIPTGLPEIVRGVASQSTLGFDLDLVEVVPYVQVASSDRILFVPSTRLSTEIVARTAVTVFYRQGDEQPSTKVETTSLEDIEENIRVASSGAETRVWSPEEVEDAFAVAGEPVSLDILEFSKQHSSNGQFVSPAVKKSATFGLTYRVVIAGKAKSRIVYYWTLGWAGLWLDIRLVAEAATPEQNSHFLSKLRTIMERDFDHSAKWVLVKTASLSQHLQEFKDLMLWLRSELSGEP